MRWVTILLQSLNGLVAFSEKPIQGFEKIKRDKITISNKYNFLPELNVELSLFFPRTTFLILTKLIYDMGFAKDIGEAEHEWLLKAIRDTGYRKGAKAQALASELVKTHEKYTDIYETTQAIYRTIHDSQLIPKTRSFLKEQMEWSKKKCRRATEKLAANH